MKSKLKALAAAIALGVVGSQANAAILDSQSGNGELFLVAWSTSLQRSYTRDLGVQMDNFLVNTLQGSATGGTTAPVTGSLPFNPAATPAIGPGNVTNPGYSLTFQSDATMLSWLGNGASLASDVVWMVGAMDGTGTTGTNQHRFLTTVANGVTETGIETSQRNNNLVAFKSGDVLLSAVNAIGTHATGLNGSATASAGEGSADAISSFGARWVNKATFDSINFVGQSADFYYLTPSSTLGLGFARADQFKTAGGLASKWTLASNGNLNFSTIPVPAAVWLFGSGLIGLVGIARRRKTVAA
jgi:hypothetical protein